MEVDPLLLALTCAIHMAWQQCPRPIHQPKVSFLERKDERSVASIKFPETQTRQKI